MGDSNVVKAIDFRDPTPPDQPKLKWEAIDRWDRTVLAGAKPEKIASILKKAERGDFEGWADLCEHMLRTDGHVRGVYETLLRGVASAELTFKPGRGDPTLASEAAEFLRESHSYIEGWDRTLMHLLHASGVGLAIGEHHWDRVNGGWHVTGHTLVPMRDAGFTRDWGLRARTSVLDVRGRTTRREWLDLNEEPARWLWSTPGSVGLTPNVSGILMSIAWPWLFKIWAVKNVNVALERIGLPMMLATVPKGTTKALRLEVHSALRNMAAGHAGVIEEGVVVSILGENASANAGKAHTGVINLFDDQITKGILGSTLNTDAPSHHGNRAVAVSQADVTVHPRMRAVARGAAACIKSTWAYWVLAFNRDKFGGRMPPVPETKLELTADQVPLVDDLLISVGGATVDEARKSRGLLEWGKDRGGEERARPVAKAPMKKTPQATPDVPPGTQLSLLE